MIDKDDSGKNFKDPDNVVEGVYLMRGYNGRAAPAALD